MKSNFVILLVFASVSAIASTAGATAIFGAAAFGALTWDPNAVAPFSIDVMGEPPNGSAVFHGMSTARVLSATAEVDGAVAQAAFSGGWSSTGGAAAQMQTTSIVRVENTSSTEADFNFELFYWIFATSRVDRFFEDAEASARVFVESLSNTTPWTREFEVPSGLGLGFMSDFVALPPLTVLPGEFAEIRLNVDTDGRAQGFPVSNGVPAPATLSLLLFGVAIRFARRSHSRR